MEFLTNEKNEHDKPKGLVLKRPRLCCSFPVLPVSQSFGPKALREYVRGALREKATHSQEGPRGRTTAGNAFRSLGWSVSNRIPDWRSVDYRKSNLQRAFFREDSGDFAPGRGKTSFLKRKLLSGSNETKRSVATIGELSHDRNYSQLPRVSNASSTGYQKKRLHLFGLDSSDIA